MRNVLLLLIAGSLGTSGCIIYDQTRIVDPDNDRVLDRDDRDGLDEQDEGLASEFDLYLTPDKAEVGETFIASVRTHTEHDLIEITQVTIYGDAEVLAEDYRDKEILLTVQVSDEAQTGALDLLVEFSDGSATWIDAALQIFDAESGHSAGSSQDDTVQDGDDGVEEGSDSDC